MKVIFRSPPAVGRTSVSNAAASPPGATAIITIGIIRKDNLFMLFLLSNLSGSRFSQRDCEPVKPFTLFREIISACRLAVNDQHITRLTPVSARLPLVVDPLALALGAGERRRLEEVEVHAETDGLLRLVLNG